MNLPCLCGVSLPCLGVITWDSVLPIPRPEVRTKKKVCNLEDSEKDFEKAWKHVFWPLERKGASVLIQALEKKTRVALIKTWNWCMSCLYVCLNILDPRPTIRKFSWLTYAGFQILCSLQQKKNPIPTAFVVEIGKTSLRFGRNPFHPTKSLVMNNKVRGGTFWYLPRCAEAMALSQGMHVFFTSVCCHIHQGAVQFKCKCITTVHDWDCENCEDLSLRFSSEDLSLIVKIVKIDIWKMLQSLHTSQVSFRWSNRLLFLHGPGRADSSYRLKHTKVIPKSARMWHKHCDTL